MGQIVEKEGEKWEEEGEGEEKKKPLSEELNGAAAAVAAADA